MPTANPLEQLRRRMLSHATPAAFAALAEEHRRAGRLEEAIAVCRDGLSRYPTYVSARVTLGRALLDSGDVVSAVAELDQAVGQAPDNLAAVRALEAARAALAELPDAPSLPSNDEMVLHPDEPAGAALTSGDCTAPSIDVPAGEAPASTFHSTSEHAWAEALGVGVDGPQEFGLAPDWTVPASPTSHETPAVDALVDPWHVDDPTEGLAPHADAPTMPFVPPHLQGEEPAGIWPVPGDQYHADAPAESEAGPSVGAPVFGWSIAAPGDPDVQDDGSTASAEALEKAPSIWDEPTIEVPVVDTAALPSMDASADPASGASGDWGGLFVEPVSEGAAPAAFAGWDAPGPSVPEPPPWVTDDGGDGDEKGAEIWGLPSSVVETTAPSPLLDEPVETATVPSDASVATEAGAEPGAPGWEGSVASALDEVFTRAGKPASLEPPTHASPAVRETMADAAVEAAIEDAALRDETLPPALVSLQQMLDAVRARRAALSTDLKS